MNDTRISVLEERSKEGDIGLKPASNAKETNWLLLMVIVGYSVSRIVT